MHTYRLSYISLLLLSPLIFFSTGPLAWTVKCPGKPTLSARQPPRLPALQHRAANTAPGRVFVQRSVFPFRFSKVMELLPAFGALLVTTRLLFGAEPKSASFWKWTGPARTSASLPHWLTGYLTGKEWCHIPLRKGTIQSISSGPSLSL